MLDFHQKDTFASNFKKIDTPLYEKAMGIFVSYNPKIKVWIEETAYDPFGRLLKDSSSIHTNANMRGKFKWTKFFDANKLINGELKPKQTIKEKIKSFLW